MDMKRFIVFILSLSALILSGTVLAQPSTPDNEKDEAFKFLKTYMPLSDRADYSDEFFKDQVRLAYEAREFFSWGKSIPDDIFRHFVLVYRVNNENLDTARAVFFNELKNKVKDLSMYDAALEVNHWCHEYVNYKAADGRTSAPLSTIRTSHGRCGEESTFTVTALRSVSIPARQCYTPRWAHVDNNHAWVEVWINGTWYYLGACEPEPELNIAWFDAPAKRAMMVHTNVFGGNYEGDEEVNFKSALYSKINLLENYTDTKKLLVKVVDKDNKPIQGIDVEFGLYNYSEFFPIGNRLTDQDGFSYLTTGYGDLMVWASNGKEFAYKKISVGEVDTLTLVLEEKELVEYEEIYEVTPPAIQGVKAISGEKVEKNNKRLLYEDSIRNAYIASFPNQKYIDWLSREVSNFEAEDIEKAIKDSWGNYREIENFIKDNRNHPETMKILKLVYEKDLRDTPKAILESHLNTFLKTKNQINYPQDIIDNYILNPRIQLELITTWREYIANNKDEIFSGKTPKSPEEVSKWVEENIELNTTDNYYNCQISPKGVIKLGEADHISREILFVAIARTLNFPARYNWATEYSEYYKDGNWIRAIASKEVVDIENRARLIVKNSKKNSIKPDYYVHFTVAQLIDGKFKTLAYKYETRFENFPDTLHLDPGYYRVLISNRDNEGKVYVKTNHFWLEPKGSREIEIELREIPKDIEIKGSISLNTRIITTDRKTKTLREISDGKGMVLAIIDPTKEPTRHLMVDIPMFKYEFENWGGGILFVVPESKLTADFAEDRYEGLPSQTSFSIDRGDKTLKATLNKNKKLLSGNYPILLLLDKNGNIVFASEGYRFGSGEHLIKTIYQLD